MSAVSNSDERRLAQLPEADHNRFISTRNEHSKRVELGSELALAFARQQMEPARKLTAQLQYLNRIGEEIDAQTPVR